MSLTNGTRPDNQITMPRPKSVAPLSHDYMCNRVIGCDKNVCTHICWIYAHSKSYKNRQRKGEFCRQISILITRMKCFAKILCEWAHVQHCDMKTVTKCKRRQEAHCTALVYNVYSTKMMMNVLCWFLCRAVFCKFCIPLIICSLWKQYNFV